MPQANYVHTQPFLRTIVEQVYSFKHLIEEFRKSNPSGHMVDQMNEFESYLNSLGDTDAAKAAKIMTFDKEELSSFTNKILDLQASWLEFVKQSCLNRV